MDVSNWIVGVVVGLIVCLIVVLILQNTVFKDKEMKMLYMIMFVLFAVCGGVVQNTYFTVSANAMPTPQEQIEEIDKTINDNWKTPMVALLLNK